MKTVKKEQKLKPGIGGTMSNAKACGTERTENKKIGSGGLPSTYFANSKACNTETGKK